MNFAYPWCALLALPLAFAAWRLFRRSRQRGVSFSALGRLPAKRPGLRAALAAISPWVLSAAFALLVFASMRPRTPLARETRSVDAIAIAMAVDVSGSMEALDLTPQGEQYSMLTADHAALLNVLKGVEIPSLALDDAGRAIAPDEQMTAIGDGLACALDRLKDAKPASKIAILLSDGVSNAGAVSPDEAAAAAAKLGVKVYAIGVGTKSRRTPIIMRRPFTGEKVVSYTDTTFDEGQLKSIAGKTGGRYFSVNDRDSLAAALEEIDTLEKTKLDADSWNRWNEEFAPFLLAGAALALLAVFLSVASARRIA